MAAQAGAECLVLENLDLANVGFGGVGEPDWGRVRVDWLDDGIEGANHCFL